jgi:hypothetical protein
MLVPPCPARMNSWPPASRILAAYVPAAWPWVWSVDQGSQHVPTRYVHDTILKAYCYHQVNKNEAFVLLLGRNKSEGFRIPSEKCARLTMWRGHPGFHPPRPTAISLASKCCRLVGVPGLQVRYS